MSSRSLNRIADARTGESRLVAELDRAAQYHRSVTVALVRIPDEAGADAIAAALRPMDLLAEDAGDDYLLILPELGRVEGHARVAELAAGGAFAIAHAPDDGTVPEALLDRLRAGRPRPEKAPALPTVNMRGQLAEIERGAIEATLAANHGNQTRTALQLGISRRALIYKMEKYGLKPPGRSS